MTHVIRIHFDHIKPFFLSMGSAPTTTIKFVCSHSLVKNAFWSISNVEFTYLNNRIYEITLLFKYISNNFKLYNSYRKNALWRTFLSMDSTPIITIKFYLFPCFLPKNISTYLFDYNKKIIPSETCSNILEYVRACSIPKNDSSSVRCKTKRFLFRSTYFC